MAKQRFLDDVAKRKKFLACVFVKEGPPMPGPGAVPGMVVESPQTICDGVQKLVDQGLDSFFIFGIGSKKSIAEAYEDGNVLEVSIRALRSRFGDSITIFADLCFGPYTKDGHSVIMDGDTVMLEETREVVCKMALSCARAGADLVAPSHSTQSQVADVRKVLDEASFHDVGIMGYSAKFASSFFGPHRATIESPLRFGGKEAYQLAISDTEGALEAIRTDDQAGADIVMVKPALGYGDIITKAKGQTKKPVAVFNVSGEYAMVKAAAQMGYVDEGKAFFEMFSSFFRAGADIVITYATNYAQQFEK